MMRWFTILLGLWVSAASILALAQSPGPTITQDGLILQSNVSATGNGTPINVGGFGIITYQVTALSGTATIVPESSIDGTNYNTLTCYALDGTTSVTSFSGTGTWRCNVTGQNWARARISSCVACTVSVQATKWVSGQVSKAPTHIPVTVPEGGTGDTTLASGAYLKGAGTSPVTTQAVPIPCSDGGTGLTSGTSGGVLAYTGTCTLASSGVLPANALIVGGGAGVAPSALAVTDDTVPVNNGTLVQLKTVPDCQDSSGNHLNYTQSSNTFSCGTTAAAAALRSYLAGLTMSTPGSSGTMTIAAGYAVDSTNAQGMTLASSLPKTTASWAVGSNNGCLDTGSIANSTWYHFYVIERTDLTVTDVLCSLSASAPTMPTNYTYKRRIGSGKMGTGVWLKFTQDGDYFQWDVPVADLSVTPNSSTAATATVTVPTGVNVLAICTVSQSTANVGGIWTLFSDLAIADTAAAVGLAQLQSNTTTGGTAQIQIRTNTSAQFRYRMSGADVGAALTLNTVGWIDRRGRDS